MTSQTKHQPQNQEIPRTQNKCPQQRKKDHDSQKKVKVEGTHTAYTFHPNLNCTCPMVASVSTQTPIVRPTAESIPVTVYKLAMGQFAEVPHPTTRSLNENSNPPPLEYIPNAPVRQGTPWPNVGSASVNLFKTRKDWPFPPYSSPHHQNRRTTQNYSNLLCHGDT